MRTLVHTLPLAAAILLAACSGGDADTDGDGEVSGAELAEEAEGMIQPLPGQYRAALELLEFEAPGVPDSARQQMQQIFASSMAEGNTFCMTEEDVARNGAEEMVKSMAEGDCTMKSFNVAGGDISAEMQCTSEGTPASTVRMDGQIGAESSTMTMEMEQDIPEMGATRMKMRVTSQRIGDCTA